jgi:hypothetical protein
LLGRPLDEARIFQIGYAYEQSTDWHKAAPLTLPELARQRQLNTTTASLQQLACEFQRRWGFKAHITAIKQPAA